MAKKTLFGGYFEDVMEECCAELSSGEDVHELPFRKIRNVPVIRTRYVEKHKIPSWLAQGINRTLNGKVLYRHQLESWDYLNDGEQVILSTPTASGKTMAYNPAIVSSVLKENATALYLFPLVDLAVSQKKALEQLVNDTSQFLERDTPIKINSICGTQADGNWLERMKGDQNFVLTTPDTLHRRLLPNNYPNWRSFFSRLRYVVLDEAHCYNGIFGTNMAFILRRLQHKCAKYGNTKLQFILCSATIASPRKHAENLTAIDSSRWQLISKSSAGEPGHLEIAVLARRSWLVHLFIKLLCSQLRDPFTGNRRPVRTILFVRSRSLVNRLTSEIRDELTRQRKQSKADAFTGYMAGLNNGPETFEQLMDGTLQSIITTNKLMAGIDIGSMDVSIVYGFQGKLMDMRQMFGRAARKSAGAWIFVGQNNSSDDQYLVDSFPAVFECKQPEKCIVDLDNELLKAAHFECLSYYALDKPYLHEGPCVREVAQQYWSPYPETDAESRNPEKEPPPWRAYPFDGLQLRGSNVTRTFSVFIPELPDKEDPIAVPENLAYRDYHPGAIFEHESVTYEVASIDFVNDRIEAIRSDTDRRTRGKEKIEWQLTQKKKKKKILGFVVELGSYHIEKSVGQFDVLKEQLMWCCPHQKCDFLGEAGDRCKVHNRKLRLEKQFAVSDSDVPVMSDQPLCISLDTNGVMICVSDSISDYLKTIGQLSHDEELEKRHHIQIGLRNLIITSFEDVFLADAHILSGLVDSEAGNILLYDEFPGGMGTAAAIARDKHGTIFHKGYERLLSCKCKSEGGCSNCVAPLQYSAAKSNKTTLKGYLEWLLP